MSSGTEEMEVELMQEAMQGVQDFRYGIAKISQGLRKFRIAKFSQSLRNFAMHSFSL